MKKIYKKHKLLLIIPLIIFSILIVTMNNEKDLFSNISDTIKKYSDFIIKEEQPEQIQVKFLGYNQTKKDAKSIIEYDQSEINTLKAPEGATSVESSNDDVILVKTFENAPQDMIPESVTFQLKADGKVVEEWVVGEENNWKTTIHNLPKLLAANNAKEYLIVEEETNEGELINYHGEFVIDESNPNLVLALAANTFRMTLVINKKWNDNNNITGLRPESIQVNIKREGTVIDTITMTENGTNTWEYYYQVEEYYNPETETIYNFTVEEINPTSYYNGTIEEDKTIGNSPSFYLTNTIDYSKITKDINVTKEWNHGASEGKRMPSSVTIKLLADGTDTGKSLTLTQTDNWQGSFKNVPIYSSEGVEIDYSITENTISYYNAKIEETEANKSFKVTNTFERYTTENMIAIYKNWNDNSNAAGKRPESITFELYANGNSTGQTCTLNNDSANSDTWYCYMDSVYIYDEANYLIDYTVKETDTPNFYVASYEEENMAASLENNQQVFKAKQNIKEEINNTPELQVPMPEKAFNVTNTFVPPTTEKTITIKKVWDDKNDVAGKRGITSLNVTLTDNSDLTSDKVITLNKNNNWTATLNVRTHDDYANELTYSVKENFENEYYTKSTKFDADTNTFTLTNTIDFSKIKNEIVVTKEWNNGASEGKRMPESITIYLYKDGTKTNQSLTLNDANNWQGSFTNVNKYNSDGTEIDYSVDEGTVAHYSKNITEVQANTIFKITNTFSHDDTQLEMWIYKKWDDNNNAAGKRPKQIELEILKNGVVEDTITLTEEHQDSENTWRRIYIADYAYDEANYLFNYQVREKNVSEFYTVTYNNEETDENLDLGSPGYKLVTAALTNKFVPPTTEKTITIKKVWNDKDNVEGKRGVTSIDVTLTDDSNLTSDKTITLSESNNWTAILSVRTHDDYANELTYSVKENFDNEFYTSKVAYNESTSTFTITNTLDFSKIKKDITTKKYWDDEDNKEGLRPTSTHFQLYRNGTALSDKIVELSESNSWTYTFKSLPKYDENNKEIVYSVEEIDNFKFYYSEKDGFNITNIFDKTIPTTKDITVTKDWQDNNNQNNTRPEAITVIVLDEKGEVVSEGVLSESNNWTYDFKVRKYNSLGEEINYKIDEKDFVEGYTKVITNFDLVNQLKLMKISTHVTCAGGTITGAEEVYYGSSSTPNNIVITPDNGFVIDYVKVNGKKLSLENYDKITLSAFEQMVEDTKIEVCFMETGVKGDDDVTEEEPPTENPETATANILIILTILSLTIIALIKYNKKLKYLK